MQVQKKLFIKQVTAHKTLKVKYGRVEGGRNSTAKANS